MNLEKVKSRFEKLGEVRIIELENITRVEFPDAYEEFYVLIENSIFQIIGWDWMNECDRVEFEFDDIEDVYNTIKDWF